MSRSIFDLFGHGSATDPAGIILSTIFLMKKTRLHVKMEKKYPTAIFTQNPETNSVKERVASRALCVSRIADIGTASNALYIRE
jgi:hypothetical protein